MADDRFDAEQADDSLIESGYDDEVASALAAGETIVRRSLLGSADRARAEGGRNVVARDRCPPVSSGTASWPTAACSRSIGRT